ncbi:NAD-dependent epimerase/dehydratase family protein [Micromonospora sp. NPDC049240]|uniref:NAD-dependent epimerase/dehydratase family protein n=1 Tax=Micromonospora sp. NPDC049240 TaxID=3155151 RepID=UPI0033CB33D9
MGSAGICDTRAVVSGAGGFIGSHLAEALLAQGHRVVGIDRRSPDDHPRVAANLAGALSDSRFTLVEGDLVDLDLVELLTGSTKVFHLAAVPGVRPSWGEEFEDYARANVLGTHRLLTACKRTGVRRLVYASSSSVYGLITGPSRETDTTAPLSPYGVSKLAGEHLCQAFAGNHGDALSIVMLRYFTVYGPRQRPDMAIQRMLTAALGGVPFTVFGDASQSREFTYVGDVVDATVAAGVAPVEGAVAVNVGGGGTVTLREVLGLCGKAAGRPVPLLRSESQVGDVPLTSADLSRAQMLLGFRPRVDLPSGLARQAAWIRSSSSTALLEQARFP